MYKKILEKLANAGTVALVGYEIGANINNNENKHVESNEVAKENTHSEVVIFGIIILIILAIAIVAKIYKNKRIVV